MQHVISFNFGYNSYPVEKSKEYVINNTKLLETEVNKECSEKDQKKFGVCLVTGEKGIITRTHSRTPINKDSKILVGFQKNSGYDSYGKEQGYNAPIIKSTEFAYVTALNTLLKSKSQRILIGDASTVFWSKKPSSFESDFMFFFKEPDKDNPDAGTEKVKTLFKSVEHGTYMEDEEIIYFTF